MTAVQQLITHLRTNGSQQNASELAAQFGVSERLVGLAMANMAREAAVQRDRPEPSRAVLSLVRAWNWVLAKPAESLLLLALLGGLMLIFGGLFPVFAGVNIGRWAVLSAIFLVPCLQFLVLLFAGNVRLVLIGAASDLVYTVVGLGFSSGFFKDLRVVVAFCFGWLFIYLLISTLVTVTGSFWRMKREARAIASMSRQEMLDRLLEIRTILEQTTSVAATQSRNRALQWMERNAVWLALALSLVMGTCMSWVFVQIDPGRKMLTMQSSSRATIPGVSTGVLVAAMLISIIQNVSNFALGLLSPRFRKTVLIVLMYILGHEIATLLPTAYLTYADMPRIGIGRYVMGWASFIVLITMGGMARQVYEFARSKARSRANDPDALMEEMFELELRLTPTANEVTVLAVDVAGSTEMKRGADPLVAEWSFREYQNWVEKTCAEFGGKVHATAGDGAFVGFGEPASAMDAATALLDRLEQFNNKVNRLAQPFVLRIGLHKGDVQGNLTDVQFTRVIDVAAHVESLAPRGGVAVTESVAQLLTGFEFQKSAATTDGHAVYSLVRPEVPASGADA
ncbi:MAG: adenylate/guanylate cyclase domain-containing protein [Armatimonadetes bacterium]|nr:adenylate/guanylate cyclase domain-containing protein [Armatimonadota bacterium]